MGLCWCRIQYRRRYRNKERNILPLVESLYLYDMKSSVIFQQKPLHGSSENKIAYHSLSIHRRESQRPRVALKQHDRKPEECVIGTRYTYGNQKSG